MTEIFSGPWGAPRERGLLHVLEGTWRCHMRELVVTLMVTLLVTIWGPRSSRAEDLEVEKLIDHGLELRTQRRDREALELFEKAYEISRGARALAQVALAEQALGRWVDAERHLKAAIEQGDDPWIKGHARVLSGAFAVIQRRLGSLEITGNVPGSEVRVNGEVVGRLPLGAPLRVSAGSAVIDVTQEGYWPVSQTVIVPAGSLARETINLVERRVDVSPTPRAPEPAPVDRAPESTRLAGEGAPPSGARLAPAGESAVPRIEVSTRGAADDLSIWGYAAAGGAALGLALGVVELVVRNDHFTKYNDDDVCLAGGRTRRENCRPEKEAAERAATWSAAGFVSGGALALVAAALFLFGPSGDQDGWTAGGLSPVSALVSCGLGPMGSGLVCGGRFE